jgi:hypothetical protein
MSSSARTKWRRSRPVADARKSRAWSLRSRSLTVSDFRVARYAPLCHSLGGFDEAVPESGVSVGLCPHCPRIGVAVVQPSRVRFRRYWSVRHSPSSGPFGVGNGKAPDAAARTGRPEPGSSSARGAGAKEQPRARRLPATYRWRSARQRTAVPPAVGAP